MNYKNAEFGPHNLLYESHYRLVSDALDLNNSPIVPAYIVMHGRRVGKSLLKKIWNRLTSAV